MKMKNNISYWEGKFRELEVSEDVTKVFKKKVDGKENTNEKLTDKDVESLKKELKNIEIRDIKNDVKDIKNIVTFVEDAFKFEYVGILALQIEDNFYVIKCYPKYYKDIANDKDDKDFDQILQVITKYNSKYQINWYDIYDDGEKDFNKLEASLYIINDYLKNGLYSNQHEEIELNGEGEILWDKSINENVAFIQNKKPYYLDLFTRNVIDNENDYFRRLHACVISECIRYLKDIENAGCNLFKLCDVNCDELTDAVIDDFGSTEYILYRLESESRVQYITQKQNLLKLLHTYIKKEDNILQNDINCSLFGSANFHCIWEDVCTNVFDDKRQQEKFQEKINKSNWNIIGKDNYRDTLEPDIIVKEEIKEDNDKGVEAGVYFGIFDAKYYNIKIEKNGMLAGDPPPGVGDIIKQYFYQISLKDEIKNYKYVQNVLLFPDSIPETNRKYNGFSYVTMKDFEKVINDLNIGSGKIIIVWLDTKDMYKKYLKGDKITGNDIFKYIPGMTKRLIK